MQNFSADKEPENPQLLPGKRQSTDANGTMAKLVEISIEAFKEALIQMVQKATENSNFSILKMNRKKLKFQQIKIQEQTEKKERGNKWTWKMSQRSREEKFRKLEYR